VHAPARRAPAPRSASALDARGSVAATVDALGYELVELERAPRGLLRVTIDRVTGRTYAEPGNSVTVGDCEQVTRQLQYALEVDGIDYARLEVSSPGLDRPLRHAGDYARFVGAPVRLTLREPLAGRRHFEGVLAAGAEGGWQLVFAEGKAERSLAFTPDEVREARLVPVLDFKGRRTADAGQTDVAVNEETAAPRVPAAEVDQEVSR